MLIAVRLLHKGRSKCCYFVIPTGLPSHGGDVAAYVSDSDMNQLSLPTPFYFVLVSVSVFMALSTAFHLTNSPGNLNFCFPGLLVLFLLCWSFQLCIYIERDIYIYIHIYIYIYISFSVYGSLLQP